MFVSFNGSNGLCCVLGGDAGDHHSFETRVLEEGFVVAVELGAVGFEALSGPCECLLVGIECGYEFCARSAVEEVEGMASAHSAQARDTDLELADHDARLFVRSFVRSFVRLLGQYYMPCSGAVGNVDRGQRRQSQENLRILYFWSSHKV